MGQARRGREAERGANRTATEQRGAIADAVHQAVCEATGTDGVGFGHGEGRVAAQPAHVVTGQPHETIGASYVRLSDVYPVGTVDLHEMNPAATGYSRRELHAWFVEIRPGVLPGRRGDSAAPTPLSICPCVTCPTSPQTRAGMIRTTHYPISTGAT